MTIYRNIADYLQTRNDEEYIRLEGNGILDGLKGIAWKQDYWKVLSHDDNGLVVKGYRHRHQSRLPREDFQQRVEAINATAFKQLQAA